MGRSSATVRGAPAIGLMLVALLLAPLAAAQDEAPSPRNPALTGEIRLERDLRVEPGHTLTLGPNATVVGDGRILVYGNLIAEGEPEAPVTFRVPVYVFETEDTTLRHVRFEGVKGFGLLVSDGPVDLRHAVFDGAGGGDAGIKVIPDAGLVDLTVADAEFVGLSRIALDVKGPARVSVSRATFTDNGVGIYGLISDALTLDVRASDFARQLDSHAAFRVGSSDGGSSDIVLAGNRFHDLLAPHEADSAGKAALSVTEQTPAAPDSMQTVEFVSTGNVFSRNPVGVYLRTARDESVLRFSSTGDVFTGNGVGVHARLASLEIQNALFEENREWDVFAPFAPEAGAPLVRLHNSTYDPDKIRVDAGAAAVETDTGLIKGAAIGAAAVGAVGAAALVGTHAGRQIVTSLIVVPLYARLKPNEILAHEKRKVIVEYVTTNPGTHMRRIGQALSISYGALTYHIYRLEKEGYITSREEGLFKRFYPAAGVARTKATAATDGPLPTSLRRIERDILHAIIEKPGNAQSAIAGHLGLSRQALHYHIKKLEAAAFITKVPQGRETLLYAREEAIKAVEEARAAQAAHELGGRAPVDDDGRHAAAADDGDAARAAMN